MSVVILNGADFKDSIPANLTTDGALPVLCANYAVNPSNVWVPNKATAGGELIISKPPPTAPPNTTPISVISSGQITGTINTFYTPTAGKTLTIQLLKGSSESSVDGSAVTLIKDTNGDLSQEELIEIPMQLNGNNEEFNLSTDIVGNGTLRIVLRRERLDGGQKRVSAKWEGFES
jgi:hypothetical protein